MFDAILSKFEKPLSMVIAIDDEEQQVHFYLMNEEDKSTNSEFENMPFPSIPFYTTDEGIWDLSASGVSYNMNHSMVLNFDDMKNCTNNVEIYDGKCRLVSKK